MKIDTTVFIILFIVLTAMTYSMYSLSIEYEEYREAASEELDRLSTGILDAQVDLIEMKNSCNALLPAYPDAGNDQSEAKAWSCNRVLWCPKVDWRYNKAIDVCTFEKVTEYSQERPDVTIYGEYCDGVNH